MKKLKVFKNAYDMHHSGMIVKEDETDSALFYKVTDSYSEKEHQVQIYLESKVIKASCDCTSMALKCKHKPTCSHIMCAMVRAVFDYGRPKRK